MNIASPIAVRLCEGFFLWSLALISALRAIARDPSDKCQSNGLSVTIRKPGFSPIASRFSPMRIHRKRTHMSENQDTCGSSPASPGDLDQATSTSEVLDGRPLLDVRVIDGLSVVKFVNTQYLVDQDVIRTLSLQLHHLVEAGHTRMLLNFCWVQCISCGVLGMLAALHGRLERAQARLGLCGLDPLMRQMIRICHLEPVFDIYADQEEALGAVVERVPDGWPIRRTS